MAKIYVDEFGTDISRIYDEYFAKSIVIVDYRVYNLYSNLFIENLDQQTIKTVLSKINDDQINFLHFEKTKKRISSQTKSYKAINFEIVYKLHFQVFEEYLSEVIYACFKNFPWFMNLFDTKNEIPFEKIYEEASSIEEIKEFMITYRVKKIIQSNNIVDAISKIEKMFHFKFNIEERDLDKLFITAANRNILTHNNGIVNEIYIQQLRSRGITNALRKGEHVLKTIEGLYDVEIQNQGEIVKKIHEVILNDRVRLKKHHDSLK